MTGPVESWSWSLTGQWAFVATSLSAERRVNCDNDS